MWDSRRRIWICIFLVCLVAYWVEKVQIGGERVASRRGWDYKRSLVWGIKAGMKKAMNIGIKKYGFKFKYDPESYALNFDDDGQQEVWWPECNFVEFQGFPEKTIWVYVLWFGC